MVNTQPEKVVVSNPKIEPLGLHHDRAAFSCINKDLTDYFVGPKALKEAAALDAAVFVCTNDKEQVLGYFTLSSGQLDRHTIASALYGSDWTTTKMFYKVTNKYPYKSINATIIGRLAIHKDLKGQDFGGELLGKALLQALDNTKHVASKMVYLDAINEKVVPFYEKAQFQRTAPGETTMFIQMDTIRSWK